jgi:hypothetical protein
MQDTASGLRRTPLPGRWVNKGKRKDRGSDAPALCSYLAVKRDFR